MLKMDEDRQWMKDVWRWMKELIVWMSEVRRLDAETADQILQYITSDISISYDIKEQESLSHPSPSLLQASGCQPTEQCLHYKGSKARLISKTVKSMAFSILIR